jgi:deoxyribodipyrimidine photo-lyase
MRRLADGDVALNNGGWQWSAGTGNDAQPWFRIFNPVLQSKKYDPKGSYIRRYLPELGLVPDRYLHEPWLMPPAVQGDAGCRIGKEYPLPIVQHDVERRRTLEIYGRIAAGRRTAQGSRQTEFAL